MTQDILPTERDVNLAHEILEHTFDSSYYLPAVIAKHAATARAEALEEVVAWLRAKPQKPFTYTAGYIADQIERGDHLAIRALVSDDGGRHDGA